MSWDGRAESSGAVGYPAYEGAAWAVVHWMSKEHPADLDKFRASVQRGAPVEAAWAESFREAPLDGLDATVRAYLGQPDRRLWWVEVTVLAVQFGIRRVTTADLTRLREELAQGKSESVATVR